VAAKAGITKKTLYYHFASKDDLVTEYLKSRDQPNMRAYRKWFDEAEGCFADRIFAIFEGVAKGAQHPRWRGCGFLRTLSELAHMPGHPAVKAGVAHKRRFEQWLNRICEDEGIAEPAIVARRLVILMEGAFASGLVHRDPEYILEAGNAAREMIANRL
jgi:AcrR family transcriptional regulator